MWRKALNLFIMDILLNLSKEGMLCCKLSQICPLLLRKDNSSKPLPVGKLGEILALDGYYEVVPN